MNFFIKKIGTSLTALGIAAILFFVSPPPTYAASAPMPIFSVAVASIMNFFTQTSAAFFMPKTSAPAAATMAIQLLPSLPNSKPLAAAIVSKNPALIPAKDTSSPPSIKQQSTTVQTAVQQGVTLALLNDRLSQLADSLQSQISFLKNPGNTSPLQNFSLPQVINNLNNVTVNGVRGLTASDIPTNITASSYSGILPIANGGVGTSSAPTYGKMLVGNVAGSYDLVATSTLGLSGISGSGTAGQFPYFASSGTTLTATSSLFLSTTGNLGIGTTNPITQLHVAGKVPAGFTQVSTDPIPYNLFAYQNYLYVTTQTNGNLQIFDLNDPANPSLVSTTASGAFARSVYVTGKYAYVGNFNANTFTIFDISNKAAPVLKSTTSTGTNPRGVVVSGRYLYLVSDPSNTIEVYDVKDPTAPVQTAVVSTLTSPFSIKVDGGYLIVGIRGIGASPALQTFDIRTNPAVPVAVSSISTGSGSDALYQDVQGSYAYVPNRADNTLKIINISNPASMSTAATFTTGSAPFSVVVQGRYAYLTLNGGGFQVIDISNPSAPVSVGTLTLPGSPVIETMTVHGRYAYFVDQTNNKIDVVDLGGSYIQQLEAGGIKTTSLSVVGNVQATDVNLKGGLQVGQTAQFNGSVGFATTTNMSTLIFNSDTIANLYRSAASTTKTDGNFIAAGNLQALTSVIIPNGTAASPALFFAGQTTGFRRNGSGFTFVNGGVDNVTIGPGGVDTGGSGQVISAAGSASAPGFAFSGQQMGLFRVSSHLGFAVGGVEQLRLLSGGGLLLGGPDAASPSAQSLAMQGVLGGTGNTAGANLTISGSRGTGLGAGGALIFQTAPSTNSSSVQNPLVTAMTITGNGLVGVGTTSPWALFSVSATSSLSTIPLFAISTSTASATSTAFIVDSNGKVGIGTSSPFAPLSVTGTSYFSDNLQASSTLSIISTYLSTPAAPVVTAGGTNNLGNAYRYKLVVHGAGTTAASANMSSPFTGNSTLDGTHYNIVQTVAQAGATSIDIYRTQATGLTTGYVGSVTPGAAFNDTGIVATADNSNNPPPSSDTGSSGLYVSGPIVGTRSSNSNFGYFQFGPKPHVITIGDTNGASGALGGITGNASNSAIYLEGMNNAGLEFVFRSNNSSDPLLPSTTGGGAGQIATEQWVAGGVQAWRQTTSYEFGNGNASASVNTDLYGAHQWGISNGGLYSSGSPGMRLAANPAKPPYLQLTNGLNFEIYNTGYANVADNSNPTNFEKFFTHWNNNVIEVGPTAGGTGIIRSMNFTGSTIGVGTSSPWARFSVAATSSLSTIPLFAISTSTASATTTAFFVDSNGKVGIGTTSPSTQLQVSGVVTPNADNTFSLGNATYRWSAVFAANGAIQTSDARLKNNVNDIGYSLSDLLKLRPVSFNWIAQPGQGTQLGFIAQEVQPIFPEVVNIGDDANHTLGITYTGFIPVIVKSIQDIANITGVFKDKLIAWLGDASNGINKLFANEVHTKTLCVAKSDGTDVCVTGDQLAALLASSQTSGNGGGTGTGTSTDTTAPSLTLVGNNPATIHVGDIYSDPGVTVFDAGSPGIGYTMSVDAGATTTPDSFILDTSTSTTHVILYSATDQAGNTGTVTRTVVVE